MRYRNLIPLALILALSTAVGLGANHLSRRTPTHADVSFGALLASLGNIVATQLAELMPSHSLITPEHPLPEAGVAAAEPPAPSTTEPAAEAVLAAPEAPIAAPSVVATRVDALPPAVCVQTTDDLYHQAVAPAVASHPFNYNAFIKAVYGLDKTNREAPLNVAYNVANQAYYDAWHGLRAATQKLCDTPEDQRTAEMAEAVAKARETAIATQTALLPMQQAMAEYGACTNGKSHAACSALTTRSL